MRAHLLSVDVVASEGHVDLVGRHEGVEHADDARVVALAEPL